MDAHRPWLRVALVAVALAILGGTAAVPRSGAENPERLREDARTLAGAEQRALLRLFASETAAVRAHARADALDARVRSLESQVAATRRYRTITAASLEASHARVARALRLLYVNGPPPDAIALVLGAASFDDAVDAVESLRFAAEQNRALAAEAAERSRALRATSRRLGERSAALRASRDEAAAAARTLDLVVADQRRYVESLRARRRVAESRLAALREQARVAAARTAALQERAGAAADAPVTAGEQPVTAGEQVVSETAVAAEAEALPAPSAGARRLVVDAVAYSLPGRTASGLPVGHGIIAVDPRVIPLGTRVYVPGYGEAVAADVGTAIKGAIIDLWMPTLAEARGWGRRTVTITIYRS